MENLREAIGLLHPWAVDLSSSLEIDGIKNAGRICQAVEIVRMEETKRCQKVDLEYMADSIFGGR